MSRHPRDLAFAYATAAFVEGLLTIKFDELVRHELTVGPVTETELSALVDVLQSCNELRALKIVGMRRYPETALLRIADAVAQNTSLTSVEMRHIGLSQGARLPRFAQIPHLRRFAWIAHYSPTMRELHYHFDWTTEVAGHPSLRELQLGTSAYPFLPDFLSMLSRNTRVRNLRLDMHSPVRFRDQDLELALRNNWTLQSLDISARCTLCIPQHEGYPPCRVNAIMWRNMRCSWREQHQRLLDYALGLLPLRLTSYALLELTDWIIERPRPDPHRLRRLRLCDGVASSAERILAARAL